MLMVRLTVVIIILGLLAVSCGLRRTGPGGTEEEGLSSTPIFDPLATPKDREVVPEVYPVAISGVSHPGDSLARPDDMSARPFDAEAAASPGEVYRVQIFTSRLYSEAVREKQLAEEIFNLPLYLDYEVPYYKLRAGDYATRDEAENMLAEIRSIGYREAWVARVVLKIKPAPGFKLSDDPILPVDLSDSLSLPYDSAALPEGGGNR